MSNTVSTRTRIRSSRVWQSERWADFSHREDRQTMQSPTTQILAVDFPYSRSTYDCDFVTTTFGERYCVGNPTSWIGSIIWIWLRDFPPMIDGVARESGT
uniref:Uncharacterized protein n=1 Tax=Spongospora subterranea TaxID=70186 RepID=A0A0H5RDK5_9EUKA|eukprot:CRZ12310.1 hypothetical protein [Spongospora subterranea]